MDPITLEVARHRLQGIADEMQATQVNASFSSAVKEAADAAASLFLPDGTVLAQSASIPFHLGTLIPAVANVLARFPAAGMREGDIHLLNSPYHGGSHVPDIVIVLPVFHDGRLIALSASVAHHNDLGGMTPGSLPPNATEIFQEGLLVPPMLWERDGVPNATLRELLLLNVRTPETLAGDIDGQIGACRIGARRLVEMAEEHGTEGLAALCDALIAQSERRTRAELARIPEGTWHAEDWLDNDGVDLDRRVPIRVAVTIRGGAMHVDFTGTSAQTRGPINAVPSAAQAAALFAVRCITDPTIPSNGGCFRPVTLTLPEGSLVNPRFPAPVNARTGTVKRLASTILAALRPALPEVLTAPWAALTLVCRYIGTDAEGRRVVVGDHFVGGTGAALHRDGVDVIAADMGNTWSLPAETIELEAPVRILRNAIRPDSGGAGRTRGGNGLVREFEVLCPEMDFVHRGERHFEPARGVEGGRDGAPSVTTVIRADGRREDVPSKAMVRLRQGDRVRIETAAGGGWGDPRARDPERVRDDLADGKISATAARDIYGLAEREA
ncbi:hydantoinase B/oxoprolinase family protein [Falsiroseomonas sp.]|uniref:hydantoinase B/oxoprolinase family protein n=1 Tax=Falsiroseomonas sp. TaxID=2870721 RepID=UPI0035652EE2